MVIINLTLLVLGMFMDPISMLVIVMPIFFKTVIALGYDPVWFGVIVTIQIEIAAISPPVGFNLFVLKIGGAGRQAHGRGARRDDLRHPDAARHRAAHHLSRRSRCSCRACCGDRRYDRSFSFMAGPPRSG